MAPSIGEEKKLTALLFIYLLFILFISKT